MIQFSAYLLATNLMETLFRWLDVMLIGRFFAAADVGFYSRAKNVQNLPVTSISSVLKQVMFPVFSKMQDDLEKLRWGYRQAMTGVFFLVCPLMAALSLCSTEVIGLLYGPKWLAAAPLLCALSLGGMLYPISSFNINILVVLGHSRLFFWSEIVKKIIILLTMVIGLQGGLLGLAVSQVVAAVACTLLNMALAGPFIRLPLKAQLADLLPMLGVCTLAAGVAWWAGAAVNFPLWGSLLLKGTVLGSVYLLLSWLFFRDSLLRVWAMAHDFRAARNPVAAVGPEGDL
jgi:O-antigen/teichoic acid export membrane protein